MSFTLCKKNANEVGKGCLNFLENDPPAGVSLEHVFPLQGAGVMGCHYWIHSGYLLIWLILAATLGKNTHVKHFYRQLSNHGYNNKGTIMFEYAKLKKRHM